jgi:diguanylate cyclase (GGDEF)-like protein
MPELDQCVRNHASEFSTVELGLIGGKHLELRIFDIRDDDGEIGGHVLLVRDVTQAKANAIALHNANAEMRSQLAKIEEMQSLLREQAIRDPLTGLYNRRFLDEILAKQISLSARGNSVFAVVMIDIDYFKSVNDRYGHAAGDIILRSLSDLLSHRSRAGDTVCRYGGEEFAVIMCDTSIEHATRRVDEWRAEFATLCHAIDGDDVARTFSAGVAGHPIDGIDAATLLKSADAALYAAKAAGRNQVKSAASTIGQDKLRLTI